MPALGERRRLLLFIVGAFLFAQILSYQVAGYQSQSAVALLQPLEAAIGAACLERSDGTGLASVGILGSYVLDPVGGGVIVSPVAGRVRVQVLVYRWNRVMQSKEAVVSPGQRLRMRTGLLGIRSTMERAPGDRALRRQLTGTSPAPRPAGSSSYMALCRPR